MKSMNFSQKMVLGSATAILVVLGSAGVAGAWGKSDYDQELEKVGAFSDAIGAIVASMTTIAITPIGIGAAVKTFRHIVLNNV